MDGIKDWNDFEAIIDACYDEHYVDIGDYDFFDTEEGYSCELRVYSARLVDKDTFEPVGEYVNLHPYLILGTYYTISSGNWIDYQYTEACKEIEKIIKGKSK